MSKILVVDDDVYIRNMFSIALGSEGHEVLHAEDGLQGVEIARRELPDLIYLDLMMPVMDGETAARTLREDPDTAGITIVAVTAKAFDEGSRQYFDHCLRKPCAVTGIVDMTRNCLTMVQDTVNSESQASR